MGTNSLRNEYFGPLIKGRPFSGEEFHSCAKKMAFDNILTAMQYAAHLNKAEQRDWPIHVYQCDFCKLIHVGGWRHMERTRRYLRHLEWIVALPSFDRKTDAHTKAEYRRLISMLRDEYECLSKQLALQRTT